MAAHPAGDAGGGVGVALEAQSELSGASVGLANGINPNEIIAHGIIFYALGRTGLGSCARGFMAWLRGETREQRASTVAPSANYASFTLKRMIRPYGCTQTPFVEKKAFWDEQFVAFALTCPVFNSLALAKGRLEKTALECVVETVVRAIAKYGGEMGTHDAAGENVSCRKEDAHK